MSISYEGIGERMVTLPVGTGQDGQVCKVGPYGAADLCANGEKFAGVVVKRDKGMSLVQLEGFVRVGYSGSKPNCGYVSLTSDGSGKVLVNSNGREYLVVQVDASTMTAIIKL